MAPSPFWSPIFQTLETRYPFIFSRRQSSALHSPVNLSYLNNSIFSDVMCDNDGCLTNDIPSLISQHNLSQMECEKNDYCEDQISSVGTTEKNLIKSKSKLSFSVEALLGHP